MGVYIKGMNIEEDHACVRCRLSTKTAFDKLPFCDVTMKDIDDWQKRPDWCPLIPIQSHGDLIDRDALPWEKQGLMLTCPDEWGIEARYIESAPVIIPKDKEKKET